MRTNAQRITASIARTLAVACALALLLTLGISWPAFAADSLVVGQDFETSGTVPDTVTGSFSYELTRVTADAPLPAGTIGDSYAFELSGTGDTAVFPINGSGIRALTFTHAGVFDYELLCSTSSTKRLDVDTTVYQVRISIENVQGGLRLGWIEVIKATDGTKPEALVYEHSYTGVPAPDDPKPDPSKPSPQKTPSAFKMPQTGDPEWMLMQVSGALLLAGLVLLVLGVLNRRKKRAGK